MEFTFDGKKLFGDEKAKLREELRAEGCRWDGKRCLWICPDEQVHRKFAARVVGPPPVAAAPAAPTVPKTLPTEVVPPPPAAETPPVAEVPSTASAESPPKADPMPELKQFTRLKLQPSKLAFITTEVRSVRRSRRRRVCDRDEVRSRDAQGIEKLTVTTTSEMTILNPAEKKKAEKLRSQLRYRLERYGSNIMSAIIFPTKREAAFRAELKGVKEEAGAFNDKATHYEVGINVLMPEMGISDEEALARKVAYEVQRLFDEMREALDAVDEKRIKAITSDLKAKSLSIAPGNFKGLLDAAVLQAEKATKIIRTEVRKKGREITDVKAELLTSTIESARMASLDLEIPEEFDTEDSDLIAARLANLDIGSPIDPAPPSPAAPQQAASADAARFTGLDL